MPKTTLIIASLLFLATAATAQAEAGYGSAGNRATTATNRIPLSAMFHRLDTNNNGLLSRDEAASDPHISSLYDSLDTRATIEGHATSAQPGGITLKQFKAGMTTQHSSGGTVGPSVSGGGKYLVYPDGSREKIQTGADAGTH